MDEQSLRRDLATYASRGIPDGTTLAADPVARVSQLQRRPWWRPRVRVAALGALIAASLTAAAALAVASGTFPVRFNLVEVRPPAVAPTGGDTSGTRSPADVAKRDRTGLASDAGGQQAGGGKPNAPQPVSMTLAEAEAAFGTHVLVAPAATSPLTGVLFGSAATMPRSTKPGAPAPRDTVVLTYSVAGSEVMVSEERDPSAEPLTVDALDAAAGPALKTETGLGSAAIEQVNGGSYVVGRSGDGASVVWVIWKSSSGVVVTIHFDPGVAHDAALAFALTFA